MVTYNEASTSEADCVDGVCFDVILSDVVGDGWNDGSSLLITNSVSGDVAERASFHKEGLLLLEGMCYEAYIPDHPTCTSSSFSESNGYTCVDDWCAAINPGGTPDLCASAMPGYTLDKELGRCVFEFTPVHSKTGEVCVPLVGCYFGVAGEGAGFSTDEMSWVINAKDGGGTLASSSGVIPSRPFCFGACEESGQGVDSNTGDCGPCPKGRYGSSQGFCKDCAPGKYSTNPGSTSCKSCPDGKTTIVAGEDAQSSCIVSRCLTLDISSSSPSFFSTATRSFKVVDLLNLRVAAVVENAGGVLFGRSGGGVGYGAVARFRCIL